LERAATAEAAGEVRAEAAEAISGRRGSSGSEAWACCYYCSEEVSGWCSSLAFVGSGGGEQPGGWMAMASVSPSQSGSFFFFFEGVTNWELSGRILRVVFFLSKSWVRENHWFLTLIKPLIEVTAVKIPKVYANATERSSKC
jgi:hypothetical protein